MFLQNPQKDVKADQITYEKKLRNMEIPTATINIYTKTILLLGSFHHHWLVMTNTLIIFMMILGPLHPSKIILMIYDFTISWECL